MVLNNSGFHLNTVCVLISWLCELMNRDMKGLTSSPQMGLSLFTQLWKRIGFYWIVSCKIYIFLIIYQIMLHLCSLLNLSSLHTIMAFESGGEKKSVKPLVCLSADELVSWLIGLSHLTFVKDCVQSLYALGQDIGFHVLYLPYILTLVTQKSFYYHKILNPWPITSTAWKLEISKLRVRYREEGKRTKVMDTEGSEFWVYLFLYFLLFIEKMRKDSGVRSLG